MTDDNILQFKTNLALPRYRVHDTSVPLFRYWRFGCETFRSPPPYNSDSNFRTLANLNV